MYCNVHHNFWPRLNIQLVYESRIPLDKIDVTQQSIKDELTEPFVFIYITLYFPWFYLCSKFILKKKNPLVPLSHLHHCTMILLTVSASMWGCPWCRVLHKFTRSLCWRASTPVWIHLSSLKALTWWASQTQHHQAHQVPASAYDFRVRVEVHLLSSYEVPAAPIPCYLP